MTVLIAIAGAIATTLAAFFGAIVGPYFNETLDKKKIKNQEQLRYLEEAYLLTISIDTYCIQVTQQILFMAMAMQKKIKYEDIIKIADNPFPRLYVLLDYHLDYMNGMNDKINTLNNKVITSHRGIAEAAFKPEEFDQLVLKSYTECSGTIGESKELQKDLLELIKGRKLSIENSLSIAKVVRWKRLWQWITTFQSPKLDRN